MTMSKTSITSGQEKQYERFVEDAARRGAALGLKKVPMTKRDLQRLFEHGGEFQTAIAEIIVSKTHELSVGYQFADEEVSSNHTYPEDYKPKGITEQIACLHELFPELGSAYEKLAKQPLPHAAEGWFAIPRWEKVASTYGEAVEKALNLIAKTRNGKLKLYKFREGGLGSRYLKQHERTVAMLKRLGETQSGYDILVIPTQFGLRHRGRSVRRAYKVFDVNEFGLGAFAVSIMLLMHPERLLYSYHLAITCAGDRYEVFPDIDKDEQFNYVPHFSISCKNDEVIADLCLDYSARQDSGSATGFLPQ